MAVMASKSKAGNEAIEYMANFAGGTVAEFKAQLRTTAMFYTAPEAVAFATGEQLKKTMDYVRGFSFDHGLFGDAQNKDMVGIAFPDGTILGDPGNVRLRFDAAFMKMAADGSL
jgi:NitT/TauT family transport system substrate-binding protein